MSVAQDPSAPPVPVATATVLPHPAVVTGVPVVGTPVIATSTPVAAVAVPIPHMDIQQPAPHGHYGGGEWSSGIFDCCNHGCTCAAGCFCPCVVYPQLLERLMRSPGACKRWSAVLWILWLAYAGTYMANQVMRNREAMASYQEDYDEDDPQWEINRSESLGHAAQAMQVIFGIAMTWLAMRVRAMVRHAHRIRGEQLEDCCLVFWCNGCAASQLLRQLGLDRGQYELCSPNGEKDTAGSAA